MPTLFIGPAFRLPNYSKAPAQGLYASHQLDAAGPSKLTFFSWRLNLAMKSRWCLRSHIFSRNSGQPQEGENPFSASGATATPQATPFSSSPQISAQTLMASSITLWVTFRKCVKSASGDDSLAIVSARSPSNLSNLMAGFISSGSRMCPASGHSWPPIVLVAKDVPSA